MPELEPPAIPHFARGADAAARVLSVNVAVFCGVLRREHDFKIGLNETEDALRALEAIGVASVERVRTSLRLICCGSRAQTLAFDRAFDAFFLEAREGVPQAAYAPRHTRPGRETHASPERPSAQAKPPLNNADEPGEAAAVVERRAVDDAPVDAHAWHALRARYSPVAGEGTVLRIDPVRAAEFRPVAERLLSRVRFGRSRRWQAVERAGRFDLRRTIRASLATGGDPVTLRFLGHPRRDPRFVVLIDGSRSMADHSAVMVDFTAALCERSARARAFVFSTELRDVTVELREGCQAGAAVTSLGQAWGGGTKIGANLAAFVTSYGARLLTRETVVFVFSDGLDVGETSLLESALREIDRRSAGIVWLNPHAALPGYAPTARGMRSALRFATLFCAANDTRGFEELARRVAQTARIRGRRA